MIIELVWDLSAVVSLDSDLELITTRLTVLAFVVTGLDHKLNWLANSLILEETRSEAQ